MISFFVDLPTWLIIRIAGIATYVLLTVGIVLGMSYSLPLWSKKTKVSLYKAHSFTTISGMALGLLHGVFTVIDAYVPYTWSELLIPFTAHYEPVLSGLGTLSAYAMLTVILTTDLRNKLKRKVWLALHMLSYPIFIMSTIHGFFMGTDSKLPGIRIMYLAAILLVLGLTAVRAAIKPAKKTAAAKTPLQPEIISPGNTRALSKRFQDMHPSSRDTLK
ncbi:ferric reductase-like transmembrane domain-containing protein [Paenibacillus beijingensis]|uniref:ferric reductase-like transmembrane domain-containing protein n=1 Tax=Paenibacillus beijingensis TaxID=1126833 RepID=UPI000697BBA4|nr:ferric reductase-like transmembrane domain-containing protein [Paenibacillus beijingensis]